MYIPPTKKQQRRYAIVAGNGPSLAQIDYTRLHLGDSSNFIDLLPAR